MRQDILTDLAKEYLSQEEIKKMSKKDLMKLFMKMTKKLMSEKTLN